MTETKNTLGGLILRKFLRGIAVVIMLGLYGASFVGLTGAASVATSTQASAWHRGRAHWRGRGYRGRRGWWWGRRGRGWRGRGRRGRGLYFYIR